MNKTLIALAIAATLPVAAVADVTISGSLTSKYKNTGAIDTYTRLSIASSEVLANGMTATASFAILADTEKQDIATLSGDFVTLTVGEIDSDGTFQAGGVVDVASDNAYSRDSKAATVFSVAYSGSVTGLTVAVQVNSAADTARVGLKAKSSQMSGTDKMNGLRAGYASAIECFLYPYNSVDSAYLARIVIQANLPFSNKSNHFYYK